MFRELDKNESFPNMELRIGALWEKDQSFKKSIANRKENAEYIFNDGPPFATGLPHYGHLLAGTIKDIVPRFWTMMGYRVERRFGWDCHGLPIESLIQAKLNLAGVKEIRDYGVDKFNEACRADVLMYTKEWRDTVRKMGRWVDFENEYKTMDMQFMESVWWVFKQCYDKGLIYQDYRIQPYSPALATPLSNFEVNQGYEDRQDPSVTIEFPLLESDESILVWTTTPWTLPSNLAIAVHPDLEYCLVEQGSKKFWVAESRLAAYFEGCLQLKSCKGRELAGRRYVPLFNFTPILSQKQYSVLLADFVSDSDGTGVVHIAPSFGEEDFQLGRKESLGLWDPLDAEGRFTAVVPDWQGQGAKDADKAILQAIKAKGRIFRHDTIVHSYPHCWRTGVPLLYRALKTWFLSLEKEITSQEGVTKTLKEWMIHCNQQINWVPEHIKTGRFGKWLEGARDWNLSRNRFWGTPIPVWLAEDGSRLCVGSVAELQTLSGKAVTDLHIHQVDQLELRTQDGKSFDPKGKVYRRTSEVLDCWFESGSMPYAQSHYPFEGQVDLNKIFPADFIAEGLDQTRGWFYTLTVLGAALYQRPAFKNVIVNGIILAENGQKMSKRLKNYPDPNELIDRSSADAIRLFMIDSAAVKAEELKFSENGVREIVRAVLLPLWNAVSLFTTYANADEGKGQLGWKPGGVLVSSAELDRWILSRLQSLCARVRAEMTAYRLYAVVPGILEFIDELTNWYIRRSRRRFWKSEDDSDKRFAYATLYQVLVEFSKVLAPFLPFLAEEIYQVLVREITKDTTCSVHLCDFPEVNDQLRDLELEAKMAWVREAVELGRSLRSKHNLKIRQPLSELTVAVRNQEELEYIQSMEDLLREELNVKTVRLTLDESSFVHYQAKANFKVLGPKFGKNMKNVAAKVAELSHEEVRSILSGIAYQLPDGEITEQDILIQRQVKEGLVVEVSSRMSLALDTQVTETLLLEMLARECVSKIQNIRKASNFQVTDRIRIEVNSESAIFRKALEYFEGYVKNEVLADSLKWSSNLLLSEEFVEYEGQKVVFNLSKSIDYSDTENKRPA